MTFVTYWATNLPKAMWQLTQLPKRFIREFKNIERLGSRSRNHCRYIRSWWCCWCNRNFKKSKVSKVLSKRHGQSRGQWLTVHVTTVVWFNGTSCAKPRVQNKRLAGRMGGNRVTIQNNEIVQVVPEKNVIWLKVAYQVLEISYHYQVQQLKLVNNKERISLWQSNKIIWPNW